MPLVFSVPVSLLMPLLRPASANQLSAPLAAPRAFGGGAGGKEDPASGPLAPAPSRRPPAPAPGPAQKPFATQARDTDFPRLRMVLKGVLYRSGSPSESGLSLICREGWKRVYSLYGERTTDHGPHNQAMMARGLDERRCEPLKGTSRVLEWRAATAKPHHSIPHILSDVRDTIRDPAQGPVLVHCWNGLHYAGMVSALALRQFCGLGPDAAEAYWRATANRGANYPSLVQHIRDFRPSAGLVLSPAERKRVCPNLNGLLSAQK